MNKYFDLAKKIDPDENNIAFTGIEVLDKNAFAEFGKITFVKEDFCNNFSADRNYYLLSIVDKMRFQNDCDTYIIGCEKPEFPYKITRHPYNDFCYVSICQFSELLDFLNRLEKTAVIYVDWFDTLYYNNGYVKSNRYNIEYCCDMIRTAIKNKKVSVIIRTNSYVYMGESQGMLTKIDDKDYLLLDNGDKVEITHFRKADCFS